MSDPRLDQVLRHPAVWRGRKGGVGGQETMSTGFPALDEALPGGGWSTGVLMEVLSARQGVGELSLLMPALAATTRAGRWLAWVDPPHVPFAPALMSRGVDLARVLVARTASAEEGLWAAEQALRSGVCGAVLMWSRDLAAEADVAVSKITSTGRGPGGAWRDRIPPGRRNTSLQGRIHGVSRQAPPRPRDLARDGINNQALRRLQLAAEAGRSWGVLFRPARHAVEPSPAPVRLLIEPAERGAVAVSLLKCRGRGPGTALRVCPDGGR
jgi:hypothetical protein